MKKLATILMLIAAILVGGMTLDAKTTKKKAKARTTQTSSSALWNGDIPSAAIIIYCGRYENQLINHGYRYDGLEWTKPGVCSFTHWRAWGGWTISIIPDSNKRTWLYNNIKSYIRNSKDKEIRKSTVSMSPAGIEWEIMRQGS